MVICVQFLTLLSFFWLHRLPVLTIGYSVAPCHLLHCYTIMLLLYSMLLGSVINNWLKPRNFPLGRGWCNSFTPTFTTHTLSPCVTPTLIYITSILSNKGSLLPSLNEELLHSVLSREWCSLAGLPSGRRMDFSCAL